MTNLLFCLTGVVYLISGGHVFDVNFKSTGVIVVSDAIKCHVTVTFSIKNHIVKNLYSIIRTSGTGIGFNGISILVGKINLKFSFENELKTYGSN